MSEYVFLLVSIQAGRRPGETRYLYPAPFHAEEMHLNSQGGSLRCGSILRGEDRGEALYYCRRDLAERYAVAGPMRILSEAEADAWCDQHVPKAPAEIVTSPERLAAIQAKGIAGVALSDDDVSAADPDSPTPGINRPPPHRARSLLRVPE